MKMKKMIGGLLAVGAALGLTLSASATNVSTLTALKNMFSSGGTATMTAKITLSGSNLDLSGKTLTLDLNGQTLNLNGQHLGVVSKGVLTIQDSKGGGRITGGSWTYGGAVELEGGSTLYLKSGTISSCSASLCGGAISVGASCTLNMSGGTISGNTAGERAGGVFVDSKGSLTMSNGTISGNTAGWYNSAGVLDGGWGGGVCIVGGSTFTMNGGTITGNKSVHGGGVHARETAKVTIKNGTISNNTGRDGAGIYAYSDTSITINDGTTISGNTAEKSGGGVCLESCGLYMNGGTICNNKASTLSSINPDVDKCGGGAIGSWDSGQGAIHIQIKGGHIYGNSSVYSYGGCICINPNGNSVNDVIVSGCEIYSNTAKKGTAGVNQAIYTFNTSKTTISYTISYNNNGGTGSPANQTKSNNTKVTLSGTKPTRTGYTFNNWNTAANGTGTTYKPSASYTGWDLTPLYAQWTANTYTIAYSNNNGSGAPASGTATYDVDYALSKTTPTRTGYAFKCWNTKSDGSGTDYDAGATVKNLASSGTVTLYAKWTANTYTVAYNGNGSTSGTAPANATWTYDTSYKTAGNPFSRTGYTFASWNTQSDGKGATCDANKSSYKNLATSGTVTLYAIWTPITYKVAYDGNGATGGSTGTQTWTYDAATKAAGNGFSRTGYTFNGWNSKADGTGTAYNANNSSYKNLTTTSGATVTLYAQWKANTYTVSFNQNGGSGGQGSNKTATYDAALPDVAIPTRPGYAFRGYFDAATGGNKYYYGDGRSAKNWNKTANTILYAQWKPAAEANVLPSGYTRVGAIQSSGSQYIDTKYVHTPNTRVECEVQVSSSQPAAWGCIFGARKTAATGNGSYGFYPVCSGNTAACYYTSVMTYDTIAFPRNEMVSLACGGKTATWNSHAFSTTGSILAAPCSFYVFAMHTLDRATDICSMTLYSFKIYEGTTLVRNFIPCTSSGVAGLYDPVTEEFYKNLGSNAFTVVNPTVTVTLDPNGGAGGTASVSATFGQAMPEATMPTRTGYVFEGYFDAVEKKAYYNANGTSAALWDSVRPTTLSAEWTAKDYDLNLDTQGGSGASTVRVVFDVIPPMIEQPTKDKRKFGGYFTEPEGRGTMVFDEYGIATEPWTTDEAVTLYANWIMELSTTEPEAFAFDLREVKPAQVFKPEMLTSSPKGWEADAATATILEAIGEGQPVTVVDTVTAPVTVWTPQNVGLFTLTHTTGDGEETAQFSVTGFTYRVEFDANGGTGDAMAGVDLAYGAEGTAPACTYTRTDYEFDGWNTRKDGSGTAIAVGEKYKNLVTDASETGYLYAQWTLKTAYTYDVAVRENPTGGGDEPQATPTPVNIPRGWIDDNLPSGVDKNNPEEVQKELEKKDETGLKTWQKYVLGVDKDDKSAKVWIDSPQQKSKDKIKVKMREFSPTKGTGFQVKYRLDTQLKGANEKAKGELANSPDFDIDLSGDKDPTGLYTVNVVFVPEGKDNSDEVVESVNTMGILKVPSQKTLEIVAVPWNRLAPDANQAVLVADLVKTATLTPGDKLHVYDRAKKTYKSWKYDIEKGWVALGTFKVTAAGLEQTLAPDQTEQTVARGSAVWLERQDASKPFYLYGQYSKDEVATKITARQHNLVACPKMTAFRLNDAGRFEGTIGANDQIIVPQGGNTPPKTYTYKAGQGWGYSKFDGKRFKFDTTDDEVPVGTGFWYISKGGSPTIKW